MHVELRVYFHPGYTKLYSGLVKIHWLGKEINRKFEKTYEGRARRQRKYRGIIRVVKMVIMSCV